MSYCKLYPNQANMLGTFSLEYFVFPLFDTFSLGWLCVHLLVPSAPKPTKGIKTNSKQQNVNVIPNFIRSYKYKSFSYLLVSDCSLYTLDSQTLLNSWHCHFSTLLLMCSWHQLCSQLKVQAFLQITFHFNKVSSIFYFRENFTTYFIIHR